MASVKKLLKKMKKRNPDAEWLCDLLALWKPSDEIFDKSYVYVRPRKATVASIVLDNADGFYTGLPILPASVQGKTRRMRVPKSIRIRSALGALEARQKTMAAQHAKFLKELQTANESSTDGEGGAEEVEMHGDDQMIGEDDQQEK